jgi:hypothetical protein
MLLEPDDVEAIAERVLALLRDELLHTPARLVDATALAHALGVDRTWVYAHAEELHAVRLGGEHGRLRFDIELVLRSLNGDGVASQPARPGSTQQAPAGGGRTVADRPLG